MEGELSEGGEGGAGTWWRPRVMEVQGTSGLQNRAQPPPRIATAVSLHAGRAMGTGWAELVVSIGLPSTMASIDFSFGATKHGVPSIVT